MVARLPRARFSLPASEVAAWIGTNRELIDREQFLEPDTPSHAVTASIEDHPGGPGPAGETAEPGGATASALVAACEAAWNDIRSHHPELPDAVVILGTGVERGRLVKLGHWWGGRWVADGQSRGEVLIAGEALHLPPREVFEVLLHEAAHGINAHRRVRDTSRSGRYHNQLYADAAREVLLDVRAMPPHGLANTSLTPPPSCATARPSSTSVTPCASPASSTGPSVPNPRGARHPVGRRPRRNPEEPGRSRLLRGAGAASAWPPASPWTSRPSRRAIPSSSPAARASPVTS